MAETTTNTTSSTPSGSSSGSAPSRPTGGPPKRRGFVPKRKVCRFCADQVRDIDYKQIQVLRSFTTERGKILSSRVTGVCSGHQRQLARCIKRARALALLSFVNS